MHEWDFKPFVIEAFVVEFSSFLPILSLGSCRMLWPLIVVNLMFHSATGQSVWNLCNGPF